MKQHKIIALFYTIFISFGSAMMYLHLWKNSFFWLSGFDKKKKREIAPQAIKKFLNQKKKKHTATSALKHKYWIVWNMVLNNTFF